MADDPGGPLICRWTCHREWIVPPPPAADLPRRVDKPWGNEVIWAWTSRYVGKVITIEAGKRLSLQYHEHKDEWIYVLDGRLRLTLEGDDGLVETSELPPGLRPRRDGPDASLRGDRDVPPRRGLDPGARRRRPPRGRLRPRGHEQRRESTEIGGHGCSR